MQALATQPRHRYLTADSIVDHAHPSIRALARTLAASSATASGTSPAPVEQRVAEQVGEEERGTGPEAAVAYARAAYEWVRDEIRHSVDACDPRVTVRASEVLHEGVGLCYAKSHLLTALLRAAGIPAGLCYQRLADGGGGFVVHGLVGVYLDGAWHRLDARGNRPGLDARFDLGVERLAWAADPAAGERDYPRLYVEPAAEVVQALTGADDALELCRNGLPSSLSDAETVPPAETGGAP